ncbi:MAG: DUF4097 domain-containing protein, partial [Clostridiales Family XIII bacterium]|nr:DUF4097 domain-containing protein [Clostridiales Family XIII bacterium]
GKVGLDEVDAQGAITVVNKYGDVDMADIRAGSLAATLDAGSINIDAITAKGELAVVNRYGKIGIDEAAAGSLKIELDAGNLLAGNIKAGALSVDNDYGDIGIDRLELTGMGEIKSDTGNVDISLSMDEGDLSYEFDAAVGKVAVDGKDCARSIINRAAGAKASLNVNAKFGNITARFVR